MVPFNHFLSELNKLDPEVKQIFYDFFSNENPFLMTSETHWRPNIDIYSTEKGIIIKAELAGIKQENIKIIFENNKLRIKGIRHDHSIEEQVNCQQIEIPYGDFERIITLQPPVNKKIVEDDIHATYKDGFLLIYLPFSDKNLQEKRIEIQVKGE